MNLLNKFDQAQSTDRQWERYIKEVLKTEWQKPGVITVNEDRPMKYKVTTKHLVKVDKGDVLVQDKHEYWTRESTGVVVFNDKDIVERNPDWFVPIEQVEEGNHFKKGGAIYRVMGESIYDDWDWDVLRVAGDSDMPIKDDYKTHQIEHRKLSTDEIEEALIKEAKRMGYIGKGKFHSLKGRIISIDYGCGWEYRKDIDQLKLNTGIVYEKGNWAKEIDQTPDIEINGYKAEFHEEYVKFGCAKISKALICDFYREYKYAEWGKLANKCNRSINGVKIGEGVFTIDQIKEIASYYEKQ